MLKRASFGWRIHQLWEVFNLVSPLWRISRNPGNRRIWYAILFRSHRTILKTSIELISRNRFVIDWYRECQLFLISQKSLNGFTDCTWELLKVECGVHSLVVCSSVALKTTSICYQCPNYQCQNVYCAAKIAFFLLSDKCFGHQSKWFPLCFHPISFGSKVLRELKSHCRNWCIL